VCFMRIQKCGGIINFVIRLWVAGQEELILILVSTVLSFRFEGVDANLDFI